MELEELGKLLNHAVDIKRRQIEGISLPAEQKPGIFGDIKKRLKWILLIFIVTTLIFAPYFISQPKSDFIFLFLFMILSIESIVSIIAFRQIWSIEHSQGNITQNLLHRIQYLKSIFRSYIFLNSFLYILLAFFVEYSIYQHLYPNLEGFAVVPLPARIILYMFFIYFQYVIKRRSFQKNYGDYFNNMISVLEQTHEE